MPIKIIFSFLILFLGLPSLVMAENSGYFISDTPVKISYIICSEPKPQECNKDKKRVEPAVLLSAKQKAYAVKNIPEGGVVRVTDLTTTDDNHNYTYPDNSPCLLSNNEIAKFEVYDNKIFCSSQPVAVAVPQN